MSTADLANRLRKNQRHWSRWARREGIDAYRLYDRDISGFPYAVDRYADWLYVQRFEGRRPLDDAGVAEHLDAIAAGTDTPVDRLVLQARRRQRGSAQYERTAAAGRRLAVLEHGLRFEVNLGRYLDTGLFLDHRDTRAWLRAQADGRTVLNLFAYTGSFSVYAAAGGARRTVTVDMSSTYQHWTRRNFLLNDIDDFKRHRLVCADALRFLTDAVAARARFDLIVLDPPSFSNSKRMQATFDVQRDHLALLRQTVRLLAPAGRLVFSNNRRGFRLDDAVHELGAVEEITGRTVPPDFRRHPPHRCWLIGAPAAAPAHLNRAPGPAPSARA
ncbi:MAG: class I SAM-dependent methyltransferase [Gammaproteobacteria bacterium]